MEQNNIGLSPDYVKDWTIEEAIRELIQNYIDTRDELDCRGHISFEDGQATIKDYGPGLELRHLVMGISEKSNSAIGQFGEGLKLALLVFAREDRFIEVKSRGKVIKPVINYSEQFETELISLSIEDMAPHVLANHKGTTIRLNCTEAELSVGKEYFIDFRKQNQDFNWVVKDKVSLPGGDIWIKGSKVGEVENAYFSYHFDESANDAINRDRGSIDTEKLMLYWKEFFQETRSLTYIKEILSLVKGGEQWWETTNRFYDHDVVSANLTLWKRAVTSVFGDVVLSSNLEYDQQARYKGYEVIVVDNWRWVEILEKCGLKKSSQVIKEESLQVKEVTQKSLPDFMYDNLKFAKEVISKYYNKLGRVKVVNYFDNSTNSRTLGAYDRSVGTIYILRDVLEDRQQTVEVLLHECVHKYTATNDCTAEFEDELGKLAAKFLMELSSI